MAEQDVSRNVLPAFCMDIPRVLVTPSRVAVVGFGTEVSNRVTRHYLTREKASFHQEAFLRLSIGDENGDKLFSDELSENVQEHIKDSLLHGVSVNGRTYRFLAYSSSQLKELSVWMVYLEHGITIPSMRDWMGDFSSCQTPSKYAARIGQCFSTTVQTLEGQTASWSSYVGHDKSRNLHIYDRLDDISSQLPGIDCTSCHSDGTGLISKERMKSLVEKVPFGPANPSDVSIIQVRFGGAKGTLVAWDFTALKSMRGCQKLPSGFDVYLRKSQVKFKAEYRHLEVISVGSHVPYYLNRNVILLLGTHGIRDDVFLRMQARMMHDLNEMISDPKKAQDMLPRVSGPDGSLIATLLHMISLGLSPKEEPFVFDCLHAIRTHHLQNLRKKARIHVRDGAVLMGGIDETGLVHEGSVFVNVRKKEFPLDRRPDEYQFEPLLGPVLVTKHPVMHPGDVRRLIAVDIPQLRNHKNVILFSQHGERPEADKMAGSDLDGDQFAVTWDNRLLIRSNHPPMDYDPPVKPSASHICDETLVDHFIAHARKDNLGRIAMMWLDYAAMKRADCDECIKLAELHSVAVDYPKSGVQAHIPQKLVISRNMRRAHWRERNLSYQDDGVLGKLYDQVIHELGNSGNLTQDPVALAGRKCDKNGVTVSFVDFEELCTRSHGIYNEKLPNKLGFFAESDKMQMELLEFANDQRLSYEEKLRKVMNKFGLRSEGEVMTGFVRKYHRLHKRRRHEISEEIKRECREIRKGHRLIFFEKVLEFLGSEITGSSAISNEVSGTQRDDDSEDSRYESKAEDVLLAEMACTSRFVASGDGKRLMTRRTARVLAASYYVVTYDPSYRLHHSKWALFSFPWLVADVMDCTMHDTVSMSTLSCTSL
jgi:RNA-dependent RNA polymerase